MHLRAESSWKYLQEYKDICSSKHEGCPFGIALYANSSSLSLCLGGMTWNSFLEANFVVTINNCPPPAAMDVVQVKTAGDSRILKNESL